MWLRHKIVAAVSVGMLTIPLHANAASPGWLKDRQTSQGIGYTLGNFELHPGIGGEIGFDSNMFQRHEVEKPISTLRFRITPSLSLSTQSNQRANPSDAPRKIHFSVGLSANYNEYIRLTDTTENVSKFRNLGADLDLDLVINPTGLFGGHVFGNFIRTIQPSNYSDLSASYDRMYLKGGGEVIWRPGGGLFSWTVGYNYSATLFEKQDQTTMNNGVHTIGTRGRWKFFPKTALLFELDQSFLRYGDTGKRKYLLDSNPLRASLGLNGLFTKHFGLLAMVGWGVSFQKRGAIPTEHFDSLLAHVQASYFPTPALSSKNLDWNTAGLLSKISVGYNRNFQNSYLGNYYQRDRGYISATYMFAGRVLTETELGFARLGFPTLYFSDGSKRSAAFHQSMLDASLFVEYRVIKSVGINTTLEFIRISDHKIPISQDQATDMDELGFNRFQAFIGARWFM